MQYYVGCSGFYNKDWKEVFYPKGLPQSKWFEYYCTKFNSLEINTTFYRFPKPEFLEKWYNCSPETFKFSVKAPRLITHYKQFNECESLLIDFYSTIRESLKGKLGPVLFQLPAKIIYSDELLQRIVHALDSSFINAIEFRNISWWNDVVFKKLSAHNIVFCGISIKNLPDEIIANTQNIYYRFHGLKKLYFSEYSPETIKDFAAELQHQTQSKTAFIYFNNTATMAAINNANQLKRILNIDEQPSA